MLLANVLYGTRRILSGEVMEVMTLPFRLIGSLSLRSTIFLPANHNLHPAGFQNHGLVKLLFFVQVKLSKGCVFFLSFSGSVDQFENNVVIATRYVGINKHKLYTQGDYIFTMDTPTCAYFV